jgi:RNA polymerase sigma factor (sigma-70 family)
VGLVRDGHDRAFEEIVRRYRSSLVTFAGGIVPGDHAEDVVQEALTKAHTALGRGDAEINLRPWLYTIVRNGALNALRDEPVHDHLDESFDGVPQPPDVAARREELASLTARVRGLPDPQREAIVKRELEGRSHEEIASSLGVSAGAVRGLIYRARATLRDGAGILIPVPVLRALLSSGSATPEAAVAAGAAAGLAAGGGGVAVKAGATLGVAVIAVGSGFAIQHRSSRSDDEGAGARIHASRVQDGSGSSGDRVTGLVAGRDGESRNEGPGSGSDDSSGPDGHEGSSGSSSGPGPGSDSGSGSSGEGSGTGDGGESGPSGDDGGDGGIDDGGSSGSGDGGGGVTSGSSDDGGSSGSGSSGSGSSGGDSFETSTSDDGEITTTTTTSDDGGGGSSGSG